MNCREVEQKRWNDGLQRLHNFVENKRAEFIRAERVQIDRTLTTCQTIAGDLAGYLEYYTELDERSF